MGPRRRGCGEVQREARRVRRPRPGRRSLGNPGVSYRAGEPDRLRRTSGWHCVRTCRAPVERRAWTFGGVEERGPSLGGESESMAGGRYARLVCGNMESVVLRVRLISGASMDVTYEQRDAGSEDEVVEHVVSTLSDASGVLRCRHGDRLLVL